MPIVTRTCRHCKQIFFSSKPKLFEAELCAECINKQEPHTQQQFKQILSQLIPAIWDQLHKNLQDCGVSLARIEAVKESFDRFTHEVTKL